MINPAPALRIGENRIPCPKCERGPKDTALAVRLEDNGHVVFHCHRCGYAGADGDETTSAAPIVPRQVIAGTKMLSTYGRSIWKSALPIAGAAQSYLEKRVCQLPSPAGHLRYLPSLRHPSHYEGPALIGLVTDALTGEPMSLHRTWILASGSKAPIATPRLLLKDHVKSGGVIRLWPGAGSKSLGIAEGIETALTLAWAMTPVWSCIDAGNLAAFPLIDGIEELVIAADTDKVGLAAAATCTDRWKRAGRRVRVLTAEQAGQDLNDEVRQWAK
jgi:hypothetical protein